jgi:hypothetical protein
MATAFVTRSGTALAVTPPGQDGGVGSSLRFAAAVRALAVESRKLGLEVPGFRSPPRLAGADRSLRWRPGATPAVAVRLAGRPFDQVAADMVEGVVVANGLSGGRAGEVRDRLLAAVADVGGAAAA